MYYISLTPTTNQFGTTTITIVVRDTGYLTASTSFALTVVSVNDTPVFEPVENQITPEDTAIQSIAVTVTDIETASCDLVLTFTSSTINLITGDDFSYTAV